ncbi:MAG: hypothetical protein HY720_09805, partial [Planctomycetes bacterium]|nr:hypothetical protein [Planctomycetota bacterium]
DLDREVLVVFNKMQGDEAYQTILADFNREMRERRPEDRALPAFRVPHYGRGGPAPDARRGPFAPVLERLARGPDLASLKRRGFAGTARYLVRQARRVLDVHAREREQLARIVADVKNRAAVARSEYETDARRWGADEFHELTSAERSVLESYRLVPVLGHVRQGVGKVFSFVKSKLFGREGSSRDVAAKIARRREVAYERALGIARQAATETSAALRRSRDGSEVARPVYERLADLDSLPVERLKAIHDARVTALDELTARIEDRLRKELDSSPAKRATLQFLRDVLPLGGLAAVVIPGGIHVTDIVWGSLSAGVSEFALRGYFGAIVREFREEFVRRHLEIFDEILATGYTDRALAAIPEGPGEGSGPAARLREGLDRLEELAAVPAQGAAT